MYQLVCERIDNAAYFVLYMLLGCLFRCEFAPVNCLISNNFLYDDLLLGD